MAEFDTSKAYRKKGDPYFDDGREIELLHFVHGKSNIDEIRNSPEKVVAAIDEFARTKKYLMNVGEDKGKIVAGVIAETKPKIMVELGGYVGYSSVLFGDAFRKAGGQRYYTLEHNAEFAAVITSLVDLAGLSETVKVIVGDSDHTLKRLHGEGAFKDGIDFLFIDHTAFDRDVKLSEKLGLIRPGSVVVADNCIYPGHPEYTTYMESSVEQKRAAAKAAESEEKVGNPNLVYESKLVHSFEPSGENVRLPYRLCDCADVEQDGVEISKCVGVEA